MAKDTATVILMIQMHVFVVEGSTSFTQRTIRSLVSCFISFFLLSVCRTASMADDLDLDAVQYQIFRHAFAHPGFDRRQERLI